MRKFLLLALLLGCKWDAFSPPDATPFVPLAVYRTWYHDVELCSGISGDFDRINFQTASEIHYVGLTFLGYWTPAHTITFRSDWVLEGRAGPRTELLAKHEFMHDLLQTGSHPPKYFNGVCGNLYPD